MWRFLNSIEQRINVLLYILENWVSVSIGQYVAPISHWIHRLKNAAHFDILANNLLITSADFLLVKTKLLTISYEQSPAYTEKPARQRRPSRTRTRFNKKKERVRRDWESKAKRVRRREEGGCRMEARRRAGWYWARRVLRRVGSNENSAASNEFVSSVGGKSASEAAEGRTSARVVAFAIERDRGRMLENRWARKRTTWRKTGIEKDTRFSGLVAERDAAACCRTSLGRGKRGILVKGGETAADRGHGRRGEVAINKYTENRQGERERESGRSSHEEAAREREKDRGWKRRVERSARRVCPTVGPFLRPQSPHESNRRSFSRYRERKKAGQGYDGTRLRESKRGTRQRRLWREALVEKTGATEQTGRGERERERERDGIQGCEERSRKREEGQRRVGSRRWGNEINEIPSNAMEPRIEEEPFAKGTHEHYCLANSELPRSFVSTEFLADEESANRLDVVR